MVSPQQTGPNNDRALSIGVNPERSSGDDVNEPFGHIHDVTDVVGCEASPAKGTAEALFTRSSAASGNLERGSWS